MPRVRKSVKKPDSKKTILGVYLAVCFVCIVWLTAHLFVSRPEAAPEKTRPAAETVRPRAARGRLAFVIDDAGYDNGALEAFLRFPGPLAVSVLPGLPGSAEAARKVRAAGKELLLHLPMEAEGGENPGPGAVYTRMTDETVARLVSSHIASLPGAVGANNHMGSRATADERIMRAVLGTLKKNTMFFLDSGTTALTTGRHVAKSLNVPFLERSVFLDNEKSKASILEAVGKGKVLAEKRGYAVMIGHVWCSELAEVLMEVYPDLLDEGYRFYPLAELLQGDPAGDDPRN